MSAKKPTPAKKPAPAKKPGGSKPAAKSPLNRRDTLRAQRLAEARRHRRNRILVILAVIVAVAVIVTGLVLLATRTNPNVTPASPTTSQTNPPDGNNQRAWITVPSSNTKDDALIVDIHTDYQCPYCEVLETAFGNAFAQLNARGDIIWRQHTRTFLDGIGGQNFAGSTQPAVAAACVDVVAPDKYSAYHMAIFAGQPSKEGTGYTQTQLRETFPATAGLTSDELAKFQTCYDSQATLQWVMDVESNNLRAVPNLDGFPAYLFGGMTPNTDTSGNVTGTPGATIGVPGTPTLFVQGKSLDAGLLLNVDSSGAVTPKIATDADTLLALLQQVAQS